MNARLLPALTLLLLFALPFSAQNPPGPPSAPNAAPLSPASPLQMSADERQFFALGLTLARAAFAYAELARQTARIGRTRAGKTRGKSTQGKQWEKLAPVARRDRQAAREGFAQAAALMRALGAPPTALAPIARAAEELAKPLTITPEARPFAATDSDAALTLSSLSEFETLSSLPEDPALRRWLTSPGLSDAAPVWYGEGEVLGLAQIAAADHMPSLLPPAEQIATDLRGLRDWLSLRLPDTPSPAQITLKTALDTLLQQIARGQHPGVKSRKPLTSAQLQALGDISRRLQAQVLGR